MESIWYLNVYDVNLSVLSLCEVLLPSWLRYQNWCSIVLSVFCSIPVVLAVLNLAVFVAEHSVMISWTSASSILLSDLCWPSWPDFFFDDHILLLPNRNPALLCSCFHHNFSQNVVLFRLLDLSHLRLPILWKSNIPSWTMEFFSRFRKRQKVIMKKLKV